MVYVPNGANWPGGSFDPETGILYVFSNTLTRLISLANDPKRSDMDFINGGGGGDTGGGLTVQGLPLVKPPWGRITAIDLNKGEMVWQVAHGETLDSVKNHPLLKGVDDPADRPHRTDRDADDEDARDLRRERLHRRRRPGSAARSCTPTTRRRAKEVGNLFMPAPQTGSPMTYMLERQAVSRSSRSAAQDFPRRSSRTPSACDTEVTTKAPRHEGIVRRPARLGRPVDENKGR